MRLPFPDPIAEICPFPKRPLSWDSQPRRFPPGYHSRDLHEPGWRVSYALNWIAKRKAAGLPHEITEPLYLNALAKAGRKEKRA